jgi:hypothetical protein
VLWTPEGFFTASPVGGPLIGYHLNQGPQTAWEFVTVEQLYSLYSRPELVVRRLEDGIDTEIQVALARIGDEWQVLPAGMPPTLELLSPPESQQRTRGSRFRSRSPQLTEASAAWSAASTRA